MYDPFVILFQSNNEIKVEEAPHTAFPDYGIVFVWKTFYESVRIGPTSSCDNFLLGCLWVPITNILQDSCGEKGRFCEG